MAAGHVAASPGTVARDGAVAGAAGRTSGGLLIAGAVVLVLGVVVVSAMVGPAHLDVQGVVRALVDRLPLVRVDQTLDAGQASILWQIRLPRIALAVIVGAALSGAGAAYQGAFRNPLADPYLLGAAAGAALGAAVVIAYGAGLRDVAGTTAVPFAAFAGAMGGVVMTWTLGRSVGGRSAGTLILAGVAVASFLTSLSTYVMQRNVETIREVYSFILGRLATHGWDEVQLILPYVVPSLVVVLLHARLLDVMSVGDAEASSLGVRPGRVRGVVVAAATLATAAAVAVSGLIGFIGIIVPHLVRLLVGPSHRLVLPLTMLGGAAFLTAADVVARTLDSPAEIPIGVVTAFFGAPFFVMVLRASRRSLS